MIRRTLLCALALACVVTHANARGHGGHSSAHIRGYNSTTHTYRAKQSSGAWLTIFPSSIEAHAGAHASHRMNGL